MPRRTLSLCIRTIITGILFLVILPPISAFALRVDKSSIRIELPAGETYHGTIEVENTAETEIAVKVYVEDFSYLPPFNGDKEFYPPGSTRYSLSNYIKFFPREIVIPPYSIQMVNFTVASAEDLAQVKCGVIFFESSLGVTHQDGKVINIFGRIGTLIFVSSPNNTEKISFENIKGENYELGGILKNISNNFIHLKGTFFLIDSEGLVLDRGTVREAYLLPENEVELDIEVSKKISLGKIYTLVVTFDLGEYEVAVKEIDFTVSSSEKAINILEVRD